MLHCMTAAPDIPAVLDTTYIESNQFDEHFRGVERRVSDLESELEALSHMAAEKWTPNRIAYLQDELEKWEDELDKFLDAEELVEEGIEKTFLEAEGVKLLEVPVDSGEEIKEERDVTVTADIGDERNLSDNDQEAVLLPEKINPGVGATDSAPKHNARTPKSKKPKKQLKNEDVGAERTNERQAFAVDVQNMLRAAIDLQKLQKTPQQNSKRRRVARVSKEKNENSSPAGEGKTWKREISSV